MKMNRSLATLALFCGVVLHTLAQTVMDLPLWDGTPTYCNGTESVVENPEKGIYTPSLRVYLPEAEKSTGRAIVACPGGGYTHLALNHEGYDWAEYFNSKGIAYCVLKYRMPFGQHEVPLSDARQAMRMVRSHAQEWHINPYDVGIMGSSAGGHLAATTANLAPFDVRPDFQILFYPVISMDKGKTHKGSLYALLGKEPADDRIKQFSNERNVRRHLTPPTLLLLSADDLAVPPANSIDYFNELLRNGVPASMHIYPRGGHGWGFRSSFEFHDQMLRDLDSWLDFLPTSDENTVRVACIGNSITDGHGIPCVEEYGYPAQLQSMLGNAYKVKNFGASGFTLSRQGDRPYTTHPAYEACKTFNPHVIIVKLGTNDSKPHNWKGNDHFRQELLSLVDTLLALPARPRVVLSYPIVAFTKEFGINDSVIVDGELPEIKYVAKKRKLDVIDFHTLFENHSEWMLKDGIHPNTKGTRALAQEVKRYLDLHPISK